MKLSNIKKYLLFFVIVFLIIQDPLTKIIPYLTYFDEILSLAFFPAFFATSMKRKVAYSKMSSIALLVLSGIIILVGLISLYKFHYQEIKYGYYDILTCFKYFLVIGFSASMWDTDDIMELKPYILPLLKITSYLFFILTLANQIFHIFSYSAERYGIRVNKLFFSHPTSLCAICMFLIILFIIYGKSTLSIEPLLLLVVIASTLRVKAISISIIIILMCYYLGKKNRKINIIDLILGGGLTFALAQSQINYYFFQNEESARRLLPKIAIKIARDYFPVGTGFGTFGSYFSGKHYSLVLYKYRLNKIHGLTPERPEFISDSFWPMVLGQFGVIGLIAFFAMIIIIFIRIQKSFDPKYNCIYLAKLTALVYTLASSISEASFVHQLFVPLALIIGIELSKDFSKYNKDENPRLKINIHF